MLIFSMKESLCSYKAIITFFGLKIEFSNEKIDKKYSIYLFK
jgi:hypothetical protein